MQTFMPYPEFKRSAKCLDFRRLGKQRVEAMQVHRIVSGKRTEGGWINHPAVRMWWGYQDALAAYHNAMLYEWIYRGYINNMPKIPHAVDYVMPEFIGNKKFHDSHKSNLLNKDFDYYKKFGWSVERDMPYYWPVQ